MISERFQACVRSVAVSPAPVLRVLMLVLWVWGGSCSSPRVPRHACSHCLSTSHSARGREVGPDQEQVQGSACARGRGRVCRGRRLSWQAVSWCPRHRSLLPPRWAPPGALARGGEWGCRCSHGAADWAPALPLKAPTVRQEHRPWAALVQTREASINRLKRDGRDGPALPLLGPRLPRTPVPRSPALPLPLTAGLGQQVGCGLWAGGGSVWPW